MNSKPGKLKFTLFKDGVVAKLMPGRAAEPSGWNVEDQAFANVTLTAMALGTYILAVAIFG